MSLFFGRSVRVVVFDGFREGRRDVGEGWKNGREEVSSSSRGDGFANDVAEHG